MNDPLIARFATACGATAPLNLRVDLAGGGILAEGSVAQPYTLVGRDDACDVTLSDPEINPRHIWLQVLGGRVFAVDLGSRTGLTWPSGVRGPGWLDVDLPARVGPFLLRLRAPVSDRPSDHPPDYNPMASNPEAKARLGVALEFRNGRRAKDRWHVNRYLTLIGRASDCKIHLTADDISPYHCGIVATRAGLWVVDLSGRGVVVNGERMRVAPLPQAAELWVGRFLIGCHYQVPPPSGGRPSQSPGKSPRSPRPAGTAVTLTSPTLEARVPPSSPSLLPLSATPDDEDAVELGAPPDGDGLTGSHIMADAFRPWGSSANGPVSNPIQVSGSESKSPAAHRPLNPQPNNQTSDTGTAGEDWSLTPLLRQMADLHGRTVAEFQQLLALLTRTFARVKREHLPVLLHELTRIMELTAEITTLQLEVAQQAIELAAEQAKIPALDGTNSDDSSAGTWVPPSTKTPIPDASNTPSAVSRNADRLVTLHQERAARWQALIVLFADS